MEDKIIDEDGFIYVKPKNKKKNDIIALQYESDDVIKIIKNILDKYNAKSAFLFGSYARNIKNKYKNKYNDIDILVIWKKNLMPQNIHEIKEEIRNTLNYSIDLVNMMYSGKFTEFNELSKCFIENNVMMDAINIFNDDKYIIQQSIYIGK
jgi:2C-methyl-D-erythritol 2,4-cyclodiphosphate synthase